MNKDNHSEKIISQALLLMENGKSTREIFNLLPEDKKELAEIFQVLNLLITQKDKIKPSKELLAKIITDLLITKTVTEKEMSRYLYRGERTPNNFVWREGRPSEIIIKTKIHNLMTINWKMWAPLGIVAVVAIVVIGSSSFGTKAPQAPIAKETSQKPTAPGKQPIVVAPATGDVDDAINAILAVVSDDRALFADAERNIALVSADSQAISDFGQSYNQNEF